MTCSSTLDLLDRSRESLQAAYAADTASQRHLAAQRAALCAAAALVAARVRSAGGARAGGGPQDPWVLLRSVAPELSEWADFFAATAHHPGSGAPGSTGAAGKGPRISTRFADDQLRASESFIDRIAGALGLPQVAVALPHRLPVVRESA